MLESNRIEHKRELTNMLKNEAVAFLTEQITPQVTPQVTPRLTPQVEALLSVMQWDLSRTEIQDKLKLTDKKNFKENYLKPALEQDLVVMTIPDKPNSNLQKYSHTTKGKSLKVTIRNVQMPL